MSRCCHEQIQPVQGILVFAPWRRQHRQHSDVSEAWTVASQLLRILSAETKSNAASTAPSCHLLRSGAARAAQVGVLVPGAEAPTPARPADASRAGRLGGTLPRPVARGVAGVDR